LKNKVNDAILGWKDRLVAIIEKGKAAKEFKKDVDPEQTALTMIAMIEGAILITKATGKLNYRKAILHSVEKLILGV
jgi:TetR/AcrR family transcriptional repressor of nem operon